MPVVKCIVMFYLSNIVPRLLPSEILKRKLLYAGLLLSVCNNDNRSQYSVSLKPLRASFARRTTLLLVCHCISCVLFAYLSAFARLTVVLCLWISCKQGGTTSCTRCIHFGIELPVFTSRKRAYSIFPDTGRSNSLRSTDKAEIKENY